MKNILFVCSANVDRSATAESFFSSKIASLNFKSAGTNHALCESSGTTPLSQDHLEWADLILVMEDKHYEWIHTNLHPNGNFIEILDISDDYTFNSPELVDRLRMTCPRYF